ncbi:MAG: hypothetical protein ACHP7P_03320 [Terriglobales bacterium]
MSEPPGDPNEQLTRKQRNIGFRSVYGKLADWQKILLWSAFVIVLFMVTFLLISLIAATAFRVLSWAKSWCVLSSVPLAAVTLAWIGLYRHWSSEPDRLVKTIAMLMTTVAVLIGFGEAAYVRFVRDLTWEQGGGVWGYGLLFSLLGFISCLVTLRVPRWFSVLALSASAWMLTLFFLEGIAI